MTRRNEIRFRKEFAKNNWENNQPNVYVKQAQTSLLTKRGKIKR